MNHSCARDATTDGRKSISDAPEKHQRTKAAGDAPFAKCISPWPPLYNCRTSFLE